MRKRTMALALSFLLCLVLTAANKCEGAKKMETPKKIYQIVWNGDNVKGNIQVNNFVINRMKGPIGSGTAALNPWLIGENEVRVELKKVDPTQTAQFSVGVSEMTPGEMVATTDRGNLFNVDVKNSDFKGGTAKAVKKFKSKIDFSKHLTGGAPIKESEAVAYGLKLHALFANKDIDAILREFAVKIDDYGIAFGQGDFKESFKSFLTDDLFKSNLVKIDPAKVKAVGTGPGNNIWHITESGEELIRANSADGSSGEMEILIGSVNGKLAVVR